MNKLNFVGWQDVEEGYYTKNKLNDEFGLRPVDLKKHDATLDAKNPRGYWTKMKLFHIDNTIEIKRRNVTELEVNNLNIAEALYTINKSAKISRDTKTGNYAMGNHSVVKQSKTRQTKLYELKDKVIAKLLSEDEVNTLGYHKQKSQGNEEYHYLILLEFESFKFHLPTIAAKVVDLKELGEIDIISAKKTRDVTIKFHEAENLLQRYVEQNEVVKQC